MVVEYFSMVEKIIPYLPNIVFIALIIIVALVTHRLTDRIYIYFQKKFAFRPGAYGKYAIDITIWAIAIILILINIPGISASILQLMGLILGGIIAFSSSSIIANGMSGVLIKILKQYQIGDMIEFEGEVGEVTEISFFHTEIQTVWRKLVTIPNAVMLATKFSNLSETGSIISAKVSAGYDIPRTKVEELLLRAAKTVNLEGPWVTVIELGNVAANYQINGLLRDIGRMVIAQSQLHKEILDEFSKAGISLLTPDFLINGEYDWTKPFMAKYRAEETLKEIQTEEIKVEKLLFEKAAREKALLEQNRQEATMIGDLEKKRAELEHALKTVKDKFLKKKLEARLEETRKNIAMLKGHILKQKKEGK